MTAVRLPEAGVVYEVVKVGARCRLSVGERVTFANAWKVDFLGGGEIVALSWRRESGEVVSMNPGEPFGAVFRPLPE